MRTARIERTLRVRTECYSEIIELHVLSCLCGHSAGLERESMACAWQYGLFVGVGCRIELRTSQVLDTTHA